MNNPIRFIDPDGMAVFHSKALGSHWADDLVQDHSYQELLQSTMASNDEAAEKESSADEFSPQDGSQTEMNAGNGGGGDKKKKSSSASSTGGNAKGQGGKTLDNLNTINNIADVGMDIAEESGYVATVGRTGYYSSGWNGNQYVKTLGVAKGLGYVFFGAGIVLDGIMYFTGQQSGAKTSVNIGVSAASLIIGGIPGIILGGGYFAVDKTVGWDRMMTPASNNQWVPNRAVFPDGTTIYVCFKAGTEILAQGGSKPIEQIVVGDSIYSYNLEKNAIELSKVVKSFERKTQEIYKLTTDIQKIYVTAEHPFYVVGSGWVKVKDLQAGAVLKTKVGSIEHVVNSVLEKHPETVYNIEVEGNHNYFVTNSNILVHNK